MLKAIGKLGDRLLARVVPTGTAQATTCSYYCCNTTCTVLRQICVTCDSSGNCVAVVGPCVHD